MISDKTALNTDGYKLPDGSFRAYSSYGCYTIFYVTKDGGVLCAKCATSDGQTTDPYDPQWFLVGVDVHWEGEPLTCAHCEGEIEPSYPDDEPKAGDSGKA